jgi:energy-coupling factor transporter ATP-binding protein EcfA2
MPYLFPEGHSAEWMVERLKNAKWRGEIIGPHGSGKSSLLAAILPIIEREGRSPLLIELHDSQRSLPLNLARDPRLTPHCIVVVDGYEQLSRWNRGRFLHHCQKHEIGILVTAHQSVGMPLVFHAQPNQTLAEQIVAQLLGDRKSFLSREAIHECFARHHGDLREMLFNLYDLYEKRL